MYLKFISILLFSVITVKAILPPFEEYIKDKLREADVKEYNPLLYQFDSNEKPNDPFAIDFVTANSGQYKSKSKVKEHTHIDNIIFPEDENTNESINSEDKTTLENKVNDIIPTFFTSFAAKPIIQNKPIIFPTDPRYIITAIGTKNDDSDNKSNLSTENLKKSLTVANSPEDYFLNNLFFIGKQKNKIEQSNESDESNKINQQTNLEKLLNDLFGIESTSTEKQSNEELINTPNSSETTENNVDKEEKQNDDFKKMFEIMFGPFGIVEQNKQMSNDYTKDLMKNIFDLSDDSVETKSKEISNSDTDKLIDIIFGSLDESDEVEKSNESNKDNTHNEQPSNKIISNSISQSPREVRKTNEVINYDKDDLMFLENCIHDIDRMMNPIVQYEYIIQKKVNCIDKTIKRAYNKNMIFEGGLKEIITLIKIFDEIEKENQNTYTNDETASVATSTEEDTEKEEENENRDIDEEIVTQSYNTESKEEDDITLTKADVDFLRNINNEFRKNLIDLMKNVLKMADMQMDYILDKRVKL